MRKLYEEVSPLPRSCPARSVHLPHRKRFALRGDEVRQTFSVSLPTFTPESTCDIYEDSSRKKTFKSLIETFKTYYIVEQKRKSTYTSTCITTIEPLFHSIYTPSLLHPRLHKKCSFPPTTVIPSFKLKTKILTKFSNIPKWCT